MSLTAGARIYETIGLTYSDVDFTSNTIYIDRQLGRSMTDDFHKLTCMCGLPPVHWHDLRHMYAGVLKNNSVNMKAISKFLGHASPDFTEEVYVYQEEIAYDCTILEEVWENIRPENGAKLGQDECFVPLSDEDFESISA